MVSISYASDPRFRPDGADGSRPVVKPLGLPHRSRVRDSERSAIQLEVRYPENAA